MCRPVRRSLRTASRGIRAAGVRLPSAVMPAVILACTHEGLRDERRRPSFSFAKAFVFHPCFRGSVLPRPIVHPQSALPMLPPAQCDVAVLLLFFNRPETFRLVFAEVRKARPARLFLYQDGPRGPQDVEGHAACRRIAEDIDWECEVHRNYQERNWGCDPSGYRAQTWAFSLADKVIVLEDDVVPSQSFFPFCKEMLDRYEHDPRVTMIAGFNTDERTEGVGADYFFTSVFSIWGWASWRRVVDTWDATYSWLDRPEQVQQMESLVRSRRLRSDFMQMCRDHRASGKAYFESIFWSAMLQQNGLAVMPSVNLVNNVGATADSTHFAALQTIPHRLRRIFTMPRFELTFPLRHPESVMEWAAYKEHFYRVHAWGHPWLKVARSLEELWLNLRAGNLAHIFRSVARRVRKWTGRERHG